MQVRTFVVWVLKTAASAEPHPIIPHTVPLPSQKRPIPALADSGPKPCQMPCEDFERAADNSMSLDITAVELRASQL
jgi:hypothetical protein